ncbi:MAG: DUF4395 family protein [Spirochaetia bacterium]|jgi:hypothetical protein
MAGHQTRDARGIRHIALDFRTPVQDPRIDEKEAWLLTWLVIVLAAANLFLGFCAGCAVYYWLNRLQVPGFGKTPPSGTFPGMRPKA